MSNCYLTYDEMYNSSYFCALQQACCVTGAAELSGKVQELMDVAYSLINNYMGRSLCVNTYVDRFRGNGTNVVWTNHVPVTAITGFTYRTVMQSCYIGDYSENIPVTSGNVLGTYLVDDTTGLIESLHPFSKRYRFEIRYQAGYTEIPEDIKTAMKILTTHLSQQIDSGNIANPDFSIEGVKSDTAGFTFGGSKMIKNIVVRTLADLSNLPITVFKILDKYKYSKGLGK